MAVNAPEKWRGSVIWKPQPDITVYELACAMPCLLLAAGGLELLHVMLADLPANAQRHFVPAI